MNEVYMPKAREPASFIFLFTYYQFLETSMSEKLFKLSPKVSILH